MIIYKNNKRYNIYIVKSPKEIKNMINEFEKYLKYNKNKIIGLDFEFKKVTKIEKIIALTQIILDYELVSLIYLFYPPILSKNELNVFIKLLCDESIIKILHGAESLDIPYLFDTILNKDKIKIEKFIKNLYDTKYICEYYYLKKNEKGKCGIYYILEEFKIIDKKEIKYLDDLNEKLGEIYLLEFDIYTMSNEMIEYAYYDVLYLPDLIKTLINNYFKKDNNLKLIKELTGINYYYRKNISDKFNKIYNTVNLFNNYFILYKDDKIKLIEIFNWYYYSELSTNLLLLANINYFSNFIDTMIKFIIYKKILSKNKVFISNNQITSDNKLDIDISDIILNNKCLLKEINQIYLKIN